MEFPLNYRYTSLVFNFDNKSRQLMSMAGPVPRFATFFLAITFGCIVTVDVDGWTYTSFGYLSLAFTFGCFVVQISGRFLGWCDDVHLIHRFICSYFRTGFLRDAILRRLDIQTRCDCGRRVDDFNGLGHNLIETFSKMQTK